MLKPDRFLTTSMSLKICTIVFLFLIFTNTCSVLGMGLLFYLLLELFVGTLIAGLIVLVKYLNKHTLKLPTDLKRIFYDQ